MGKVGKAEYVQRASKYLKLFARLFLFVVGQVRGRFDRLDRIRGQLTWGRDGVTEIFSEAGPAL